MTATAPTTERPEGRRRRVPPAPAWRLGGASGGALEVLTDFDRAAPQHEAAAYALWKALRDVHLWHTLAPERRAWSFPGGRSLTRADLAAAQADCPELEPGWAAFARLLDDGGEVEAAELAAGCHAVYAWTEQRSLLDTAAHFAEAAALLAPEDPGLAVYAGWTCRRVVLYHRSEMWLDRALTTAVLTHDQAEAVRALFALATLRKDQGRVDEARNLYAEGVRRAKWTKKRRLGAMAQHHLFALVAETGTLLEGLKEAEWALELYAIYAPRLPLLVHDYCSLLVRYRFYSGALPLLDLLARSTERGDELLLISGTRCLAAVGAGQWARYAEFEAVILGLVPAYEQHAASALIRLATAAWCCHRVEDALRHAEAARSVALRRNDVVLEAEATTLSASIRASKPAPRDERITESGRVQSLTHRYDVRMKRWLASRQSRREATARPSS